MFVKMRLKMIFYSVNPWIEQQQQQISRSRCQIFLKKKKLDWNKLVGVCTDAASTMLGCRTGFVELVKRENPLVEGTHCFIHRKALAASTLPRLMNCNLTIAIKTVSYIEGSA